MSIRIIHGDCRDVLTTLPAESVHCAVTSPPYWGLRDYGITPTIWGGNKDCQHEWLDEITSRPNAGSGEGKEREYGDAAQFARDAGRKTVSCVCRRCNAWRGVFGLEPTYQLYVEHSVEVFRAVRRVLRKDGTLWLNLGDSYATKPHGPIGANTSDPKYAGARHRGHNNGTEPTNALAPNRQPQKGLKHKDLCGVPWRVAFALQADGWWLRHDIIWSKPNPMPESVTDRCTKAHEYLFLLSKSGRYYFDQDAIKENAVKAGLVLHSYGTGAKDRQDVSESNDRRTRIGLANWNQAQPDTRNKRSVWEVTTASFPEAHFATFPPALIEPCILAGCPPDGTVLDPFGGAGTTGLVADRFQRNAILIELNPDYAAMAERRIFNDAPLFVREVAL